MIDQIADNTMIPDYREIGGFSFRFIGLMGAPIADPGLADLPLVLFQIILVAKT